MWARANRRSGILAAVLWLALGGCAQEHDVAVGGHQDDNPYIGNMNDYSYSGLVTPDMVTTRVSGDGLPVGMDQFKGNFVWVDYCASWCQPCVAQAQAIKSIAAELGPDTVFLTVMTSKGTTYNDVPNQETARVWADRFGFDRSQVLAATNLWAWTVPTHILYSPEGQTLFRSTGYLSADQIRYYHSRYVQDWKLHAATGEEAEWMVFGSMVAARSRQQIRNRVNLGPYGG